jgi:Domain of unknown function (DUF1707)
MGLWDRGMRQWDLRASDEDRERVVELLREHCAAGRLTLDEFSARLDEVYASRTYRELAWTTRELPRLEQRAPRSGLGIGRHLVGNGLFTVGYLAVVEPFDQYGFDFPLPVLTMLASAAIIGTRAWRERREARQLGGQRRRYEVLVKDRWHPGMSPPRWLPPPGGRPPAQVWPGRPMPTGQPAWPPRHPHGAPPPPWPRRPVR